MKELGNERLSAIIKLALWAIFIGAMLVIANLGGKAENNSLNTDNANNSGTTEETKLSISDKLVKLTDNFKYIYEIKIGSNIYYFVGSKNGNKESGYRNIKEEWLHIP